MGLVVDKLTGQIFLFDGGGSSSGSTTGAYSEVNTFDDLPSPASEATKIYIVRNSSGVFVFNRKEAGLYYSNGVNWRRLGDTPSFFSADNFKIYDPNFTNRELGFDLSLVSTGVTRFLRIQDSSGIVAYLDDVAQKLDITSFDEYTGTTKYASEIFVNVASGSTMRSLQDTLNIFESAGRISGITLQYLGGNLVQISTGITTIRTANNELAPILFCDYSGGTLVIPTGTSVYYIGLVYQNDSLVADIRTVNNWNYNNEIPLGSVANVNGLVIPFFNPFIVNNTVSKIIRRFDAESVAVRDETIGGLILGETGDRNITMTSGRIWSRLNEYNISPIDTSGSDFMFTFHYTGATMTGVSWVVNTTNQWDNLHFNDGSNPTGLTVMTDGKFANLWFYLSIDSGLIGYVYGQNEFDTSAEASTEPVPSVLPPGLTDIAILIGRLIFQKSGTTAVSIDTVFTVNFTTAANTNHNNLSGLQGGSVGHYYHLTQEEHDILQVLPVNFSTYTGTTAPNTYQSKSSINTYTGTTAPNTYQSKSSISLYTGTTAPNQFVAKTIFNGYTGITAPNQFVAKTIFNGYTGTTVPSTYQSKSSINTYTGVTAPNQFVAKAIFSGYTGTTTFQTFQSKSSINIYTGTTVPNTYVTKTDFNVYSGLTSADTELLYDTLNGGHLSGGEITPTGGINFSISSGTGLARTNEGKIIKISWNTLTGSTILGGDNFISIDYNGNIVLTSTFGSPDNVRLGYVRTNSSNAVVIGYSSINSSLTNAEYNLTDFIRSAIGSLVQDGCAVSLQPSPNQLKIIRSSGIIWSQFNKLNISEASGFTKIYQTSDLDYVTTNLVPNSIDVTNWNDNTKPFGSALSALTTNYWKKDMVFMSPEGAMFYVYGTAEYATEQEAIDAPIPGVPASIKVQVCRLAAFVIQEGATGITTVIDIRPIFSRLFSSDTPSAPITAIDHGDLVGLLDDDHPQYLTDVRGDTRYQGQINSKLNSSIFNGYTGTTVPDTYVTKINFNSFTGISVTTANNGLTKIGNNLRIGGLLTGNTNINANSFTLDLSGTSGQFNVGRTTGSINLQSRNSVVLIGRNAANVDRVNFKISATGTTYSDAGSVGIQYGGDYSSGYSNRSLVDKGYVTGTTQPSIQFRKDGVNLNTPPTSKFNVINFTSGITTIDRGSGVLEVRHVYGSEIYHTGRTTTLTTTSSAFSDYLAKSFTLAGGTYKIEYVTKVTNSNSGRNVGVQLLVDGTPTDSGVNSYRIVQANERVMVSSFTVLDLSAGAHSFRVQFSSSGNVATADYGQILITRIA